MKDSLDAFGSALADLQCVLIARRFQASNEPMRLNWKHFDILALIKKEGDVKPSDISDTLGITRSSTSKYLHHLKKHELIAKVALSGDGRSHGVRLTAQAHQILDNIYEGWHYNAACAGKTLTKQEIDLFIAVAAKITKSLDSNALRSI